MIAIVLGVAAVLAPACAGGSAISLEPAELRPGDVGVVRVCAAGATGSFDGAPLRFYGVEGGSVALLGIDLERASGPVELHVELPGAPAAVEEVRIAPRRFAEERLRVPEKYTQLDAATLERVSAEQARLDAIWTAVETPPLWSGAFTVPAAGPRGSPFGLRRFFNGEPRSPHTGIDIKAPEGAPVSASNRGRVVLADDLFFTGRTVVLDHGLGLYTVYVHLSRIDAGLGRLVGSGEPIGRVGATGRATGPHLHFSVRLAGARVDPETLLGRSLPGVAPVTEDRS